MAGSDRCTREVCVDDKIQQLGHPQITSESTSTSLTLESVGTPSKSSSSLSKVPYMVCYSDMFSTSGVLIPWQQKFRRDSYYWCKLDASSNERNESYYHQSPQLSKYKWVNFLSNMVVYWVCYYLTSRQICYQPWCHINQVWYHESAWEVKKLSGDCRRFWNKGIIQ